ncbi:PREDICTED: uncharacterized protein LOC106124537 isoform X2 [Papilio xuthus]|nr:PREDICTED: uncharacterized protein LOC106124537 isoform X2 [Papilio xuthus]XP_013176762.1 PREDICTED: uncharacterized protein LOC106124537 isoform X2 [Papilio xuthus]
MYCKENKMTSSLNYRIHLRDRDNNTKLICVSSTTAIYSTLTVEIRLGNRDGVAASYCTSMSNLFCLDEANQASTIEVTVNKKTLQEMSGPEAGTYGYEYVSASADITVTCLTKLHADYLMMCGRDLSDMNTRCSDDGKVCQVRSDFHSRARRSEKRLVYCYAVKGDIVQGNIAKLAIDFKLLSHRTQNNSLSVIGLPTTFKQQSSEIDSEIDSVEHSVTETSLNEVRMLPALVIILLIIVVALLFLVFHLYARKSSGEQAHGNSTTLVRNSSVLEFTLDNNYYMFREVAGCGDPSAEYANSLAAAPASAHDPPPANTCTATDANCIYSN